MCVIAFDGVKFWKIGTQKGALAQWVAVNRSFFKQA